MNLITARAIVEALIFASSEPLTIKTIAEITELDVRTAIQIVAELVDEYRHQQRGIQLLEVAGGYQFGTLPECAPYLEKMQKVPRSSGLSAAAIETLAIIAYKQPITKAEIEAMRGVSVESSIANLVDKNLITEVGRKDTPGRPILYGTTKQFLKHFGLNNLTELPQVMDWEKQGKLNFEEIAEVKNDV